MPKPSTNQSELVSGTTRRLGARGSGLAVTNPPPQKKPQKKPTLTRAPNTTPSLSCPRLPSLGSVLSTGELLSLSSESRVELSDSLAEAVYNRTSGELGWPTVTLTQGSIVATATFLQSSNYRAVVLLSAAINLDPVVVVVGPGMLVSFTSSSAVFALPFSTAPTMPPTATLPTLAWAGEGSGSGSGSAIIVPIAAGAGGILLVGLMLFCFLNSTAKLKTHDKGPHRRTVKVESAVAQPSTEPMNPFVEPRMKASEPLGPMAPMAPLALPEMRPTSALKKGRSRPHSSRIKVAPAPLAPSPTAAIDAATTGDLPPGFVELARHSSN